VIAFIFALFALFMPVAEAGTVYVNGVRADALRSFDFKAVDVRVDSDGNVWIEAPNYRIEVQDPHNSTDPASKPGEGIPTGKYWLVTQDNGSQNHEVEILVNGVVVQHYKSGDPQVILDLQPHLLKGTNTVTFNALPTAQPGGGILLFYIGTGSQEGGQVSLDNPQITYTRRSSDSAKGGEKSFKLRVEY
jgi:hypothetical protein